MPELVTWQTAAQRLISGAVCVIPTDTIYGIVASALVPAAVERIYDLRQRERDKPLIVLVGGWADFVKLQIEIADRTHYLLNKVWPGPVSVILPATDDSLEYLHRGTLGIAFRMPAKPELRELLKVVGPLVAPSANIAGESPAKTVSQAAQYFGDAVSYVDGGVLDNPPSALVDARNKQLRILRSAPGFTLQ